MNAAEYNKYLKSITACKPAIAWSKPYGAQEAWNKCKQGDWMLYLAGKFSGPPMSEGRRKLALCACECARLSLQHVPEGDVVQREAIELTERWARGDDSVTAKDIIAVAYEAYDAVYDHTNASANAAIAAITHDYVAAHAASVVASVANAAAYVFHVSAACDAALSACADIARIHYPTNPAIDGISAGLTE